jgi:serine/threonine-protein kinase HipA
VAEYFGVKAKDARPIAAQVGSAVSSWRNAASVLGISDREIERMASAFEHNDLAKAIGK